MQKSGAWLILALLLFAALARWNFLVAVIVGWFGVVAYLAVWNTRRRSRARQEIRVALQQNGYEILQMKYRHLRTGPFSLWNTSRLHFVFRVLVRNSAGMDRTVWARWGRRWFTGTDTLELSWEAPDRSRSSL